MNTQIPQNILGFLWLLEEIAIENEILSFPVLSLRDFSSFHGVFAENIDTFLGMRGGGLLNLHDFWDIERLVNYFTPCVITISKRRADCNHFNRGLTSEVIREAGFPAITESLYPEVENEVFGYVMYSGPGPELSRQWFTEYPERLAEAFARVNWRKHTLPPIEEFEQRDFSQEDFNQIFSLRALAWNSTFVAYLLVSQSMPDLSKWRQSDDPNSFLGMLKVCNNLIWLAKYEAFWKRLSELHQRHFRVSTLGGASTLRGKNIIRQDLEVTLPDGRVMYPGRYTVKEYSPPRITYAALTLDLPLPILESLMFVGAFDV